MKNFSIFFRVFHKWGDCHKSLHLKMGIIGYFFQKRKDFFRGKTILTFLLCNIDFYKYRYNYI